jgi:hypothetical protein
VCAGGVAALGCMPHCVHPRPVPWAGVHEVKGWVPQGKGVPGMSRTVPGAGISVLLVLYVRCCDVRACSRLCVRDSHRWVWSPVRVHVYRCVLRAFHAWVRCVRLACVGDGCSAVRARVPWVLLCMIAAWVRTLPVVVCVARCAGCAIRKRLAGVCGRRRQPFVPQRCVWIWFS